MEGTETAPRLNFYRGLGIIYTVGFLGHIVPATRGIMFTLTPWALLICGLIILVPEFTERDTRFFAWFLVSGIVTFFIEAAGVATGRIFGPYAYGDVLGVKALGVPIIIGFNWVVVLFGSIQLSACIVKRRWQAVLLAPLLVVAFDFIMEPVAVAFGYWKWFSDGVPLQNYAAWFIISFCLALFYTAAGIRGRRRLPAYYFILLSLYFALLNIAISL